MSKGKEVKRRRRRGSIAGLANMQYLAMSVALWGPMVLEKLPHGFDSVEAGSKDGKLLAWWKNKRVLIVLALMVYCIQSDNVKTRLWSIPLAALLPLSVAQHRATYGVEEQDTQALVEVFT